MSDAPDAPITAADIFGRRPDHPWSPPETTYTRANGHNGHAPKNGTPARHVRLTPASTIKLRPVHWLWDGRIALGSICLLAGREGIGKSILGFTIAAQVTRGTLQGRCFGTPRAVLVVATEDSWEHTIAPRLVAAGADMALVFRIDMETDGTVDEAPIFPTDIAPIVEAISDIKAGLVLLDPLLSRLDSKLDSHKDANVRVALEPIVKLCDATGVSVLGLIHVNKSATDDVLTSIMGSRAFAAVARTVLFVLQDPSDEHNRLLGLPKNNLGRKDLPTLTFRIEPCKVAETEEGDVWTGKLAWGETDTRTIQDALVTARDVQEGDTEATNDCADWLQAWMAKEGDEVDSVVAKMSAKNAGHSTRALTRARSKLRVIVESRGYPRKTYWRLPPASLRASEDVFTL